ncbi:hypothetical protein [Parasphingorhabdus sp.]|uniref:hypothetical protein n=1 Tax=Parasphingorhabdus sp. TaxID=2709688 RepID=UPI003263A8E3
MTLTLPLAFIFLVYASIGLFAALGAISFHQLVLKDNLSEQRYNAALLPLIAVVYIPFTAHLSDGVSWSNELIAIAIFVALAVAGMFIRLAVVVGYLGHGLWDVVHELDPQLLSDIWVPGQLTGIPLAYGAFCLAYDGAIAVRLCVAKTSVSEEQKLDR